MPGAKFGPCSCGCEYVGPYANITKQLSPKCNWERLHPGEDYFSSKKRMTRNRPKMRQVSPKKARQNIEYDKVKREMDEAGEFNYCTGCGQPDKLSASHLIPRSKREDLITEKQNIKPHCLERNTADKYGNEGCHSRWESNDWNKMQTLSDFSENMSYLYETDRAHYNSILDNNAMCRELDLKTKQGS